MIRLQNNNSNAIIILHEIYGINQHIQTTCNDYFKMGYDVFCPNLINKDDAYPYSKQETAYKNFNKEVFSDSFNQIKELGFHLKKQYQTITIIGYSVGASLAWLLSEVNHFDCIVGYYGSRIRDYLNINPKCPTLLMFAETEVSFNPSTISKDLNSKQNTTAVILEGNHGFMDPLSTNYNYKSANEAKERTTAFIQEQLHK